MKRRNPQDRLKTIALFFGLLWSIHPFAAVRTGSIETLATQGLVHVNITGLGGYQEECVQFNLTNNTGDSLYGFVEPGRRLLSDNTGEQDILIVKELEFALAPNETKAVSGIGFCCQSDNSSPSEGSGFQLGKMANDDWQSLAQLINKSDYPTSAIQNAIWVFSDGHDIRSIPAFGDENTQTLRESVASILGVEIPWYSFLYEEDSTRIFSGVANRLFAEVSFTVPRRTMISGQIHDKNGNLVYSFPSYHTSKGTHNYHIDLALDEFEAGEYRFSIFEDFGVLNLQKKFELGNEVVEESTEHIYIDGLHYIQESN